MALTYATDATTWRAYQPHLPADVRLPDDDLPTESTWAWDGLGVHLDRYERSDADTTVIVVHGAGGYGRLLAPFGRLLAHAGADVVLPDLPGYGLTACPPRQMTYERWVRCLVDLAISEGERTGKRVRLFGMSVGGMLSLHTAMAAPAGAVAGVGATTLIDPRSRPVRRGVGRFPLTGAVLGIGAIDRVRLPMPLTAPIERMSSIKAVNRLCLRDPEGGGNRVPYGFLRSWLTYEPAMEPEAFDRCPVLLAHPLADRWTPPAWSQDVLRRIPAPTTFVGLANCEHLPAEEPGMSALREAMTAWLAT